MAFLGNWMVAALPKTEIARLVIPCATMTEAVPNRLSKWRVDVPDTRKLSVAGPGQVP